MNRERLTSDRIRRLALSEGAGQFFLWDTDAPRLAVRVTAGVKSFIFESKLNRQTIRATIGDVHTWTLAAARDEARRLQAMADQGIDPRQEKRDRIAAAEAKRAEDEAQRIELKRIAAPAMEAWQRYIESRAPRWSQSHLGDHATTRDWKPSSALAARQAYSLTMRTSFVCSSRRWTLREALMT